MARDRFDAHTLDLLDNWQPPEIVPAYPEVKVRAATLRGRMAKAVSVCLVECGFEREEVARRISEHMGERVSENMLDNYASEARTDTVISLPRLLALIHVTGDLRLLQVLADPFGQVVVDKRYVSIIRAQQLRDKSVELARQARAEARRAGRA